MLQQKRGHIIHLLKVYNHSWRQVVFFAGATVEFEDDVDGAG